MKRRVALVLALVCALSLAGCGSGGAAGPAAPGGVSPFVSEPAGAEENPGARPADEGPGARPAEPSPGAAGVIVEIHDRTVEENLPCDTAVQIFYEDEDNEYYFDVIKSGYVIVVYSNGDSEDIAAALSAGRATIADLDRFGVWYGTVPKNK